MIATSNIEFEGVSQQKRNKIKLEHQIFSNTPKAIFVNKNTPLKGSTAKMRKSESYSNQETSRKDLHTADFGKFSQ